MTSDAKTFDPRTLPMFMQGNEALVELLRATKKTPTVGQALYQFTIHGTSVAAAKRFVQAMRSALSKRRKALSNRGTIPQEFALQITSITPLEDYNLTIIAIARTQKISFPKETFNAEMIELLAHPRVAQSKRMLRLLDALKNNVTVSIPASDWDMLSTAVMAVFSHEATHSHFDAENNSHVFRRF